MPALIVDITIVPDEYLKLYQGVAKDVKAVARDGRRVRFPAQILQPYVTHAGIDGSFYIQFDDDMKFVSIDRLR